MDGSSGCSSAAAVLQERAMKLVYTQEILLAQYTGVSARLMSMRIVATDVPDFGRSAHASPVWRSAEHVYLA